MPHRLLERLKERVLICDGAMGTMLQAAGLDSGGCGEVWNVNHPEKVKAIHRAYFEAGSDIVITNTFGGSPLRIKEYGLRDKVQEINRAAAQNARVVADEFDGLVLGDIGPTGQLLQPNGNLTPEEVFEGFREQSQALVEGGVDGLIVETMISAEEMALAVRGARACTDLPIIACISYDKTRFGYRTMMGEKVDQCVKLALDAGADIPATNCGLGIEDMIGVVEALRACTDKPILAQPNAGLPEVVKGRVIYRQSPEDMASKVPALIQAGANIVGGCCGTTPEFIRRLKESVG